MTDNPSDHYQYRFYEQSMDWTAESFAANFFVFEPTVSEVVWELHNQFIELFRRLLEQVCTPNQWSILQLRLEGKRYCEIAAEVQKPISQTLKIMHRRAALYRKLRDAFLSSQEFRQLIQRQELINEHHPINLSYFARYLFPTEQDYLMWLHWEIIS